MYDTSGLKRYITNGYYQYYIPNHHLANKAGLVYEHMMAAEDMLGRNLKNGEVVHHKDRNRLNNSHDNLMVFKTNSDHAAYHASRDVVLDGDVYVAIGMPRNYKDTCPICGKEKYTTAEICFECYKKEQAKNIPPKEELYEALKDKSMLAIGRKYGVSDNAVRKWCAKYGLPFKREDILKFREKEFGIVRVTKEKQKPSLPKPVNMYSIDGELLKTFLSLSDAAKYVIDNCAAKGSLSGIISHISDVCKGTRGMAYGYQWEFA